MHWDAKNAIWAVSKHADVVYASKHHEIFCSGEGTRPNMPTKLSIVDMDEPRHGQLRNLINRGFKPRHGRRASRRASGSSRSRRSSKVARQGDCDFVRDIAGADADRGDRRPDRHPQDRPQQAAPLVGHHDH